MAARPRSCIAWLRFSGLERNGVYALWEADELIYYGHASGKAAFNRLPRCNQGGG